MNLLGGRGGLGIKRPGGSGADDLTTGSIATEAGGPEIAGDAGTTEFIGCGAETAPETGVRGVRGSAVGSGAAIVGASSATGLAVDAASRFDEFMADGGGTVIVGDVEDVEAPISAGLAGGVGGVGTIAASAVGVGEGGILAADAAGSAGAG